MRYNRAELERLVALHRAQGLNEGGAGTTFIEGRIKVTPELLVQMLGGHWIATDGSRAEFVGVSIDSDGLIYPDFAQVVPAQGKGE